ncbi:MAG: dUTPase [Clostridia bacterium]|nr:dUTPase [Clostridia bacterium]
MDKLEKVFELQKMLNQDIVERRSLQGISKEEWIQKQTLAMISELSELLDEVNFKWWKNKKEVDEQLVKEELVDILHFFVSMCLVYDMSADELYSMYMDKNKENFNRQNGTSIKEGYDASKQTIS